MVIKNYYNLHILTYIYFFLMLIHTKFKYSYLYYSIIIINK